MSPTSTSWAHQPRIRGRRGCSRLLIVVVALAACSSGSSDDADLAGRTFASTQVDGHSLVDGSTVRITFTEDSISAEAGCNVHNGGATWDRGVLAVQAPMATTMMACQPELQAQDEWLNDFLTSSPELDLNGTALRLGDAASGIMLTENDPASS